MGRQPTKQGRQDAAQDVVTDGKQLGPPGVGGLKFRPRSERLGGTPRNNTAGDDTSKGAVSLGLHGETPSMGRSDQRVIRGISLHDGAPEEDPRLGRSAREYGPQTAVGGPDLHVLAGDEAIEAMEAAAAQPASP